MSDQTSTPADRTTPDQPGPAYAQPAPAPVQAPAPTPGQASSPVHPNPYGPDVPVAASAVALPPERVGRGALLALLAIPVGAVVSAVIWRLGFVASLSGVVVAAGAALLYVRGSGGRVKKGIPVVAAVIVLGIVVSFFAAVATDLWTVFPQLDPEITSGYAGRGSFVAANLFYGPVLAEYTRDIVLFALFGVLGGFGTILRLVRAGAAAQA